MEKKEKEEEAKQHKKEDKSDAKEENDKEGELKRKREEHEKGLIFRFTGVPEEINRTQIKEALAAQGNVLYVDYDKDVSQGNGWARFATAEDCKKVKEYLDSNKLFDAEVKATILEGEEEDQYYQKMHDEQSKRGKGKGGKRGKGSRRGRKN